MAEALAGNLPAGLPAPVTAVAPQAGAIPSDPIGEEKRTPNEDADEISKSRADLIAMQKNLVMMLEQRSKVSPSDYLAAMSKGFSGSLGFASGISGAMGNVASLDEEQRKRDIDNAKMRAEMAKKEYEENNQQTIQNITSKLYTKDATGNFALNPQAAQALTRLTGRPEYVQQLVADQRKRNQGQAFNSMFVQKETPEGNKVDFDKNAFKAYMSSSENPLEDAAKFADLYKKVRPLMFGSNDTSSVFDAAIMGAKDHPEIQALALKYKKLEQSGLLDEEKAYKMAMDLTNLLSKKEDSAQSREDRKLLAMMTQAIHSSTAGTTSALNAERLKKMQDELTPQQKKDYAIIEPSLKAAPKAGEMLMQVEDLKRYNNTAPDGLFSSAWESTVGAYKNSPEYLAAQNLKRSIAAMIPNTARLPGSASNLDLTKIEEGLGRLQAPNLDKKGRENIINEIDNSVRRVLERTEKMQSYWEQYRKAPPVSFYKEGNVEIPKPKPQDITDADLQATARKHNMTVEEVKKRLGI